MLRVAFYLLLDASGPEVYRNSVTAANLRPYGQSCQSRPVVFRRGIPSAAVLLCGHVVSVWAGVPLWLRSHYGESLWQLRNDFA